MVLEKLLNRLLFVGCEPTYGEGDFDDQLVWLPVRPHDGPHGPESEGEREYSFPCLVLPCPDATRLVLFFHRNAEDLGSCKPFCEDLRDRVNVHVLAIEYPGYGLFHRGAATPQPGAAQAIQHAEVALAFLQREMAVPLSRILLFGCSVGTGLAMKLAASHEDIGGLVLVAPFLSVQALASDRVGSALAWAVLPKEEVFPNETLAASVRCPTIVLHGLADEVIPVSQGVQLYNRLSCRKLLLMPEGIGHNSCLMAHRGLLVEPLARFFDLTENSIEGPTWARNQPPIFKNALSGRGALWSPAWALNPKPATPATDDDRLDDWPPSLDSPRTSESWFDGLTVEPRARPQEAGASIMALDPVQRLMPQSPLQVLLATGKPTEPTAGAAADDRPPSLQSPRGPRCCARPRGPLKQTLDISAADRFVEYMVEL